jgi:hypothetical protein
MCDAVVEGRWKLIAMTEGRSLFDRTADPGETRDLIDERPVTSRILGNAAR